MHFPAGIFRNALFLWFLHFWLKFCIQERTFFEECSRNALLECNFGMLQKCTFPKCTFPTGMLQECTFGMLQKCTFSRVQKNMVPGMHFSHRNAPGMHFWNAPDMQLFLGLRKIWFQECTFPTGMLQECTFGMLQMCTFPRKSAFLAEMLQKRTFFEECSRNALLDCTFGMLQKCTFPRKSAFLAEILLPGMLQKRTVFSGMLQECTLECSKNALFLGKVHFWLKFCFQECFGGMLQGCTFGMHFWNAPKMHFS